MFEDDTGCDFESFSRLRKENQKLKLKLKEINEIAHWRMGEVDIHLKNRLSKIQEITK